MNRPDSAHDSKNTQHRPPDPPRANAARPLKVFPPRRDFTSLSVKDLLEARDAYHVHLSAIPNVVATAIGRYLINKDDWYARNPPDVPRPPDVRPLDPRIPRTLGNSLVRPWSWPAVLVFVRRWVAREELGSDAVPSRLYLPDGRAVPTCVVLAPPDEELPPPAPGPANASEMLGGGYQCLRHGQHVAQVGTVACLVQREGSFYALTNKHVAGAEGDDVFAVVGKDLVRIGRAEGAAVTRRTLQSLFPSWPGDRTFVNIDAGLVKVDDASRWTSQVFGIGEVGPLFDATEQSVTLDLIGCPVRAYGSASGPLEGEIRALFFRYQSSGNYDYVSDLLIGPRSPVFGDDGFRVSDRPPPETRPGDSGTLWFYDPPRREGAGARAAHGHEAPERGEHARRLLPIAMQWGGARLKIDERTTGAYALATFVSTICRVLDVEIVRSWSLGWGEYWGKIGHFSVGWKACDSVLLDGKLARLMKSNQARIGFDDETVGQGAAFKMGRGKYVPLADVPDYVWVPAARYSAVRKNEPQQHFADVDLPPVGPADAPDFLARCVADRSLVTPAAWRDFFGGFAGIDVGPDEGSLPLRVWQIFDEMVGFARAGDAKRFVAAAGVLTHYVSDASQPLHCSYLHHGRLPMKKVDGREYPVAHKSPEYAEYKDTPESKIHSIYEEGMLEIDTTTVLAMVDALVARAARPQGRIAGGHDAACEAVLLMDRSRKRIAPDRIIEADDPSLGPKTRARQLWSDEEIQRATAALLAESVTLLAHLWHAAWTLGGGEDTMSAADARSFSEAELMAVYRADGFLVPMTLAEMADDPRFGAAKDKPRRTRRRARVVAGAAASRPKRRGKDKPRPRR